MYFVHTSSNIPKLSSLNIYFLAYIAIFSDFSRFKTQENNNTFFVWFQVQFEGITGTVEFGMDGSPHNKMYDIVNFRDNGIMSVVGNWSSDRDPNLRLYRQVSNLYNNWGISLNFTLDY